MPDYNEIFGGKFTYFEEDGKTIRLDPAVPVKEQLNAAGTAWEPYVAPSASGAGNECVCAVKEVNGELVRVDSTDPLNPVTSQLNPATGKWDIIASMPDIQCCVTREDPPAVYASSETFDYTGADQNFLVPTFAEFVRFTITGAGSSNRRGKITQAVFNVKSDFPALAGSNLLLVVGGFGRTRPAATAGFDIYGNRNPGQVHIGGSMGAGLTGVFTNAANFAGAVQADTLIIAGGASGQRGGGGVQLPGYPNGGEDATPASGKGGTQTAGGAAGTVVGTGTAAEAGTVFAGGLPATGTAGAGPTTQAGGGGAGYWGGGGGSSSNVAGERAGGGGSHGYHATAIDVVTDAGDAATAGDNGSILIEYS